MAILFNTVQGKHQRESRCKCEKPLFICLRALTVNLVLMGSSPEAVGQVCPESLMVELGGRGYMHCSFPDDLRDVYWFDNVSTSSNPVIRYKADEGIRSGPGFDSGEYDVQEDGSLIIKTVTTWHERPYRVIVSRQSSLSPVTYYIALKVIAAPGDQFPVIECDNCQHGCYYNVMEHGMTINCSFSAARPPVQLEWLEQSPHDNSRVEMQKTNDIQNNNGTYNSLATVQFFRDDEKLINLLVCRASWPPSEWQREKEILVDFSQNLFYASVPSNDFPLEINKYGRLQCGEPSSAYIVWKRILANNESEIIGFHSHVMTKTITSTPDVEVSSEGSLVISSPQVHHEGTYACIYEDGLNEEIQMTSVEILIPPSPPYIEIAGCDDIPHRCVLKENSTKKLTCAVYGARPAATLEWIAEDEDEITFFNKKEVLIKERSDTSDTVQSVEYKVSPDVLCGEEILIRCHLYGPLSKIMKAEATALVIPASCKENEVKEENGHNGSSIALVVVIILLVGVTAAFVIFCYIHCDQKKSATAEPSDDVASADPQEPFLHTGNGDPAAQTPNGSTLHHVEDTV